MNPITIPRKERILVPRSVPTLLNPVLKKPPIPTFSPLAMRIIDSTYPPITAGMAKIPMIVIAKKTQLTTTKIVFTMQATIWSTIVLNAS